MYFILDSESINIKVTCTNKPQIVNGHHNTNSLKDLMEHSIHTSSYLMQTDKIFYQKQTLVSETRVVNNSNSLDSCYTLSG